MHPAGVGPSSPPCRSRCIASQEAHHRWLQQESGKSEPDLAALGQITMRLARLEENEGHYAKAIKLLELALARKASPRPEPT